MIIENISFDDAPVTGPARISPTPTLPDPEKSPSRFEDVREGYRGVGSGHYEGPSQSELREDVEYLEKRQDEVKELSQRVEELKTAVKEFKSRLKKTKPEGGSYYQVDLDGETYYSKNKPTTLPEYKNCHGLEDSTPERDLEIDVRKIKGK